MSLVKTSTDFLMDSWTPNNINCISFLNEEGMFAEDVIVSTPFFCNTGVHCIVQWVAYWFHFFPNMEFKVHNVFDYGRTIVCQWEAKGVQERSFLGLPPNKKIAQSFGDTVLIFNEKNQIARYMVKVDLKLLLSNLGPNIPAIPTNPTDHSFEVENNLKLLFSSLVERYRNFSFRELECTAFFISGFSSKQIGSFLGISPRTVETHLERGRYHLGCSNRSQMIERFLADTTYFMFQDLVRILLFNAPSKSKALKVG